MDLQALIVDFWDSGPYNRLILRGDLKMKDLTANIQAVFSAKTLDDKKVAMLELINVSEAKKATKEKARRELNKLTSAVRVDHYAFNYTASGEGLSVIK